MAKSTSNKNKTSKASSSASSKDNTIKASKLVKNRDIVSICVFVSCLTAVFVTLAFNFGMRITLASEANKVESARSGVSEAYIETFKSEAGEISYDANGLRALSSAAVLGLIESDASGFVYIQPADCDDACVAFREQLSFTQGQKSNNIYAVYLEANLSEVDELMLRQFNIDINDLPTLAYVKKGYVFDRLDNLESIDNLRDFLSKYSD